MKRRARSGDYYSIYYFGQWRRRQGTISLVKIYYNSIGFIFGNNVNNFENSDMDKDMRWEAIDCVTRYCVRGGCVVGLLRADGGAKSKGSKYYGRGGCVMEFVRGSAENTQCRGDR